MAPISSLIDTEDFNNKKVSLRLTLLLIALVAFAVYEGASVYYRFESVEREINTLKELHSQDFKHLEEKVEYERARVDRRLNRIEP